MKYSLLDLTQTILADLSSDEVNSISDTTESRQVSQIIRTAYFNIVTRADLPEHRQLFQLVSSGNVSQPILMMRPDNVSRIDWIKYNNFVNGEDTYEYVTILPTQQFMDRSHQLRTKDAHVASFTFNNNIIYYEDNTDPTTAMILNNNFIIFNSINLAKDSTLQTSKTMCEGLIVPSFQMVDSFIPDLDDLQFPLLLNEAKSLAFLELKQIPHESAMKESRRHWTNLEKNKNLSKRPDYFDELPSFGRKR